MSEAGYSAIIVRSVYVFINLYFVPLHGSVTIYAAGEAGCLALKQRISIRIVVVVKYTYIFEVTTVVQLI